MSDNAVNNMEMREMQRRIAEQLGWTELRWSEGGYDAKTRTSTSRGWHGEGPDEGAFLRKCYISPETWVGDLNTAWELLGKLGANLEITIKNGPKGELLIGFWDKVWFSNYSSSPALSICHAVLDWLDAKQAEAIEEVRRDALEDTY